MPEHSNASEPGAIAAAAACLDAGGIVAFPTETFYGLAARPDRPAALARLNRDFADLLERGEFEVIEPTPPELREEDALDNERLAFYANHSYGRLRQLIDVLNGL